MGNILEGIGRGPSDDGNFMGILQLGAVSSSRNVARDGPPKSAGLCGAKPMTTDPHAEKSGGPSEVRFDLPPAARKAQMRR